VYALASNLNFTNVDASAYTRTMPANMHDSAPSSTHHAHARAIARTPHPFVRTPITLSRHRRPQFRLQHHASIAISHDHEVDAHHRGDRISSPPFSAIRHATHSHRAGVFARGRYGASLARVVERRPFYCFVTLWGKSFNCFLFEFHSSYCHICILLQSTYTASTYTPLTHRTQQITFDPSFDHTFYHPASLLYLTSSRQLEILVNIEEMIVPQISTCITNQIFWMSVAN